MVSSFSIELPELVDAVSVHVYHIWASLSVSFNQKEVVLAHVECHNHGSFCTGLGPRDFRTVVAYRLVCYII